MPDEAGLAFTLIAHPLNAAKLAVPQVSAVIEKSVLLDKKGAEHPLAGVLPLFVSTKT